MKEIIRKVEEKGECELYSPSPAPWVDGGASIRITKTQSGRFRTVFWLTGDKYSGGPSICEHKGLKELEEYLRRHSFI